jgi:hypothetical protein
MYIEIKLLIEREKEKLACDVSSCNHVVDSVIASAVVWFVYEQGFQTIRH